MCMDIKDFYLNTPMERPEYMAIALHDIPQEIITQYDLTKLVHNGKVYVKIVKGMYGLPQAGRIANGLLRKCLAAHGYYECKHTPGLWKHQWRPVTFTLVVDNFGVKYVGEEHAHHLLTCLRQHY